MKRSLNQKGFGRKEIIVVFLLMLIIMALYFTILKDKIGSGDTKAMRTVAERFYQQATVYRDEVPLEDDIYYAYDMAMSEQKYQYLDPNRKDETCDYFESKIRFGIKNELLLRCGDLTVEWSPSSLYRVYKVGKWTTEEVKGDVDIFYNYTKDGKKVLEQPLQTRAFLEKIRMALGVQVVSIKDAEKHIAAHPELNMEIVTTIYYRTKKLIAEYN